MDWWKEVSKGFINLSVVTVVVLVYGSMTNPQMRSFYGIVGLVLISAYGYVSYRLWRKGG